jgi:catechol 2,3-dioxygenase-like lactoylglutathione lyase family enzyme
MSTPTRVVQALDQKIEVVVLPVADVDRSKRFYESLGWRVDADFSNGGDWHLVQMTPPGSPCSVMFGKGFTAAAPGSVQGTFLVVDDIAAARADLVGRGVEVSEVFHFENNLLRVVGDRGHLPGPDPKGGSYFSFATFSDPDGNGWLIQQVTTRFPGRGLSLDVANVMEILREAETRHGAFEPTGPKHHWSAWYAPYVVARVQGQAPDAAAETARQRVERAAEPVRT